MNTIYSFIFILTIKLSISAQNTVGTIVNTPASYSGYTLFCPVNSYQTYMIDNCGRVVNSWTSNQLPGLTAELLADGSIMRNGRIFNSSISIGGLAGVVEKFSWDGFREWHYRCSGLDSTSHHDLKVMPNGNILLLVVYGKDVSEAVALGRDTTVVSDPVLYSEAVLEIEPLGIDSGRVVWRWDVWDHLIQNRDSTKPNYGVIAEHPERMNINYNGSSNSRDWLHANSIDYNPELDQIVLSFRNTSEFFVIDHSTTMAESAGSSGGRYGKGGDILYRWGNPAAYNRGNTADQKLYGPHDISWVPAGYPGEGNFMIFNNGDLTGISSVEELYAPQDSSGFYINPGTQAFGPATVLWSHSDSSSSIFNSNRLSSAQRMPNGNTLICSGFTGYFSEVDITGNMVWAYRNPVSGTGLLTQGNSVNSGVNSIFSVKRYGPDFAAFDGRVLIPGNPLELNFNLDNCQISNIGEYFDEHTALETFPNPTEGIIFINNKTSNSTYFICNYSGAVLRREFIPETGNHGIDVSDLIPGLYFILNSKNPKESAKFTLKH